MCVTHMTCPSGDVCKKQPDPLEGLMTSPERFALFLDIDGTLLDIAPTPGAVAVPDDLGRDLAALSRYLGGSLALVTGRSIATVDAFFAPQRFAVAGLHGAEMRFADGTRYGTASSEPFNEAKALLRLRRPEPEKVIFEDKGAAVALHYRLAPAAQHAVEALMEEARRMAGDDWYVQRGKMVMELRPAKANKGDALKSFMETAEFSGRLPIAIGDDLTDEDMFVAAKQEGGAAIRVGSEPGITSADTVLHSPADLRSRLGSIACSRLCSQGTSR